MKRAVQCASGLVLLLSACGERQQFSAASVRDSAGVQVVESRLDDREAGAAWRVSPRPRAEAGTSASGAGQHYQVVSAFRMGDGRIVVASAGTGDLRIYSAEGRQLRGIGKKGEGPGEFKRLFWAGRLRGDSIGAWDAELARLSVFDSSGRFVRSMTPRAQLGLFPRLHGVLADGSIVLSAGMDPARAMAMSTGVRRDSALLLAVGPDGAVRDTLGTFPGSEQYLMMPPGGGFVMHPLPFGRTTAMAVQDSLVAVGTGDAYQLALYQPGRGLRRIIRAGRERRRVTDDDVRGYRESMVALGARAKREQQQFLDEVPFPERMPAFAAMLPDGRGNWWIQDPPPPDLSGESTWHRVGADGRLLGILRAPAGLMIHEIGTDWVLGVYVDDDDVEHVRIHTLQR